MASIQTTDINAYKDEYCQTFFGFPSSINPNTSGFKISSGEKRESVRDGIREFTKFKLSDFSGNVQGPSAYDELANGNCCSFRVQDSLSKLRLLAQTWRGSGSSIANLGMWERCVYNYPDSSPSTLEKQRISRYCGEMAAQYYNQLFGAWQSCVAQQASQAPTATNYGGGPADGPVEAGCTDELALNFNVTANYDDGSCEYNEERPTTAWDTQGMPVSLVGSNINQQSKWPTSGYQYTPVNYPTFDAQGAPVMPANTSGGASWFTTFLQNFGQGKPDSSQSDTAQLNALTTRINELQTLIAQTQQQPQSSSDSSEVEALRAELMNLQMMMMNQPQPETKEAGLGGMNGLIILGGLAVVAVIVIMGQKKKQAPMQAPTIV
jgi:hypothetical protein